jgi:hypothetical protein
MKLKEQLELLRGKQVKLGSRMSFIYCEICDDNIEKILLEMNLIMKKVLLNQVHLQIIIQIIIIQIKVIIIKVIHHTIILRYLVRV